MNSSPVSPKVVAATTATGVVTLLMYLLAQLEFVAQMPDGAKAALLVIVTGVVTYVAGWLRTDPLRELRPRHRHGDVGETGAISLEQIVAVAAGVFVGGLLLWLLIQAIR